MSGRLEDRIAIVTGGGAGIGRASAVLFAREGARVAVADVNEEGGRETVRRIEEDGGEAVFLRTDVSSDEEARALVDETVDRWDRLDVAFNNAGIEGTLAPTVECTEENWDRTLAVNLKGIWLCMRHELRRMREQGTGGAILNMASVAGLVGFGGLPAYTASKHGVIGLTKTAALEVAEEGIRVNAICPGVIATEMIDRITGKEKDVEEQFVGYEPVGRMGRPEEVAQAALWLLSDEASFVTGHAEVVDGGFVAR